MSKFSCVLSSVLIAAMATVTGAATTTATWNGSSSNDIFDETNWTVTGAATGIVVDPATDWTTTGGGDDSIDFVLNSGDFATGGAGASGNWKASRVSGNASANSITLNDATLQITQTGSAGFITGSTNFASYLPMQLNGASDMNVRGFYGVDVELNGTSSWTTDAGTSFLQVSKLDFATLDTRVYSTANPPDDPGWSTTPSANNIGRMTVLGQPAVPGVNLLLRHDGSGGTIFKPIIPEPSSLALLALGGVPVVLRRIRRRL